MASRELAEKFARRYFAYVQMLLKAEVGNAKKTEMDEATAARVAQMEKEIAETDPTNPPEEIVEMIMRLLTDKQIKADMANAPKEAQDL